MKWQNINRSINRKSIANVRCANHGIAKVRAVANVVRSSVRVILLVKQVKAGSNELSVTYKCSEERCGFKIAAHDANCHA